MNDARFKPGDRVRLNTPHAHLASTVYQVHSMFPGQNGATIYHVRRVLDDGNLAIGIDAIYDDGKHVEAA